VDEAERIEAELAKADGMLAEAKELSDEAFLEAQSLEAERRRKLAEKLAANTKNDRRLFDAMAFAVDLRDVQLSDFTPTMTWHAEHPTQKQLKAISRFGLDPASVSSRGHAAALLDRLFKRVRLSLATPKQLRWLVKLGHPTPALASFAEASRFLSEKFT
jgi:hypothetical protein